tara:strand:- start:423 stop:641 length:219 start_codon:yes stop_codon:yes gene_type:complete
MLLFVAQANSGILNTRKEDEMKTLLWLFLLPGDLVRRQLGITVEQDGGLIRSFINMCFWGAITLLIGLKYYG